MGCDLPAAILLKGCEMGNLFDLLDFMREKFVDISWGEFQGMNTDVTISELYQLKGLVEMAIREKELKENHD